MSACQNLFHPPRRLRYHGGVAGAVSAASGPSNDNGGAVSSKPAKRPSGKNTANTGSTLPNYKTPPVGEVACGLWFTRIPNFTVSHAGAFWERIRRDYPTTQHAQTIATPNLVWTDETGLPLPRLWYISADKQGLLQLQGDCIYYNWRQNNESDVYPRYSKVLGKLEENFAAFEGFLKDTDLGAVTITGCELTYVNHIPKDQGWETPGDLSAVFKDMQWHGDSKRFLPAPTEVSWRLTFPLPTSGNLAAILAHGQRVRDKMPTLKLDLSAKVNGVEMSLEAARKWMDVAHEWIVNGFADLTQGDMQRKVWGRIQ